MTTPAELAVKLDRVADDLFGAGRAGLLKRTGGKLEPEVAKAVARTQVSHGSLTDLAMSGWRRNSPVTIRGTHRLVGDDLEVAPEGKAKGPMRVLESGRKAYTSGDRRISGVRVRKKDGVLVNKTRKVSRNTGATQGKGTWTDAKGRIAELAPRVLNDEKVAALARVFR